MAENSESTLYALSPGSPPGDEVRRIIGEEARFIKDQLQSALDREVAVHQSRKSIKRLRALLRLVRPGVAEDAFRQSNVSLRDAGRRLAPIRDATVRRQLMEQLSEEVAEEDLSDLRAVVAAAAEPVNWIEATRDVIASLERLMQDSESWGLAALDDASLAGGMRRVYRRGRAELLAAQSAGVEAGEAWHEWRKRVKYLWHHVQLFTPAWPELLLPTAEALHALSDALGDRHDLDILVDVVEDAGVATEILRLELDGRRVTLTNEAIALGSRLYAERSRAFAGRIYQYWRAAVNEQGNEHA